MAHSISSTIEALPRLMISKILLLIEQIRPRTTQIDNFRTAIPIFLETRALKAVECIRDTLATANDALILVVSEGAFVADAGEGCWSDVAVADRAFTVTLVAEPPDGDPGLFAAHDKIAGRC